MKFHKLLVAALTMISFACSSNDDSGTNGSTGGSGTATGGSTSGSGGSSTGSCIPDYGCQPEVLPTTGDPAEDCVARINQFRACVCVPPLARWTEAEDCADEQAEYDVQNGPHAGWGNVCDPSGWSQNECQNQPSPAGVIGDCLQRMFNEGPADESCPEWCVEKGHHINMTKPSYTRVACGFHTTGDGDVWSVQNFE